MDLSPLPVESVVGAFLLAFPALFSIVNPIGSALIFHGVTSSRERTERHRMAGRVAVYALIVLLVSLWLGGYVLNFFGVSLSALRIGGGLVVAVRAWGLLMQPEEHEERKASSAEPAQDAEDVAFFPLTMPLTTGPGTIAVAIALSSQRPASGIGTFSFFAGVSAAALAITAVIWLCYRWADEVTRLLGRGGARVLSRLVAFLLLCVGVQIIVTGVTGIGGLLTAHGA
ncbi:MarC family NAAT transporter [Sphingomonas nostoxanthinifaciens]|uniref:MarC family NAAT transporter n=1 Tax=Sphingomonas nostoxanthinifaciens TaxID=2872652 RepID=UPI001CC1D0C3|nr:MarC family NAAT transporter [Sphingomonas nostoxanthinifaciens]UAK24635.1 MarC family NAAT transporter [Sphingomonas nostoxanthinifaciens]